MRIIRPLLAVLVLIVFAGGSAFGQQRAQNNQRGRGRQPGNNNSSAVRPRPNGSYTFRARALPAEYSLLLTRTIFTASHRGIADANPPRNFTPTVRPTELVFRGAMCEGTHYLAGVENTGSHHTVWLGEGESTFSPSFKIAQIALDHIIITDRSGRKIVSIGQTLQSGREISDPSTLPAIANGPRPSTDPQ